MLLVAVMIHKGGSRGCCRKCAPPWDKAFPFQISFKSCLPHQSVMPFLSAAPLSEKNAGSVPGTSLPVVIVKSLCFCHPTEDNKYPHLKVPQEGLKKLYIFDETNYHFSLFTWGRTENQRKMVFPCKKMLDYVNHGRSLVISLFTFQFKIYLK